MNRVLAFNVVLSSTLLLASTTWGQSPVPHVEEAKARSSSRSGPVAPVPQHLFGSIVLSTHSEEARKFVELSLSKYENALLDDALVQAHHATEKDPKFALGFAVQAFAARRTQPDAAALAKAKSLLPSTTPDEQLLVRWMTSVEGNDLLPAITSMNDLLRRFPKDKHVVYLTAEWLYFQQDYERSRKMMEQVLQLDPNFPPALNMLGYSLIETGDPDPARAIATLKRYAEVMGSAPNPEDSLGEVSRFAGDDKGSLEHYRAALKIDPRFFTSQLGLGDTLTLMGDYKGAREEYDRAIKISESSRDKLHVKYQKTLVSFWEGNLEAGRNELENLAAEAEAAKEPYAIYEIGLGRGMLGSDFQTSMKRYEELENFLAKSEEGMSGVDRGEALAAVLREEVRLASLNGHPDDAEKTLARLEKVAVQSRDLVIEDSYECARGYYLYSKSDFANAADELAADSHSPLALRQLALAQAKLGNTSEAENTKKHLKYQRAPIVEWYLVTHSAS